MKQTVEIDMPDGYILHSNDVRKHYLQCNGSTYDLCVTVPLKRKVRRKMVFVEQFTDYKGEGMYYTQAGGTDNLYCCTSARPKEDHMISIWSIEGATE